MLHFIKSLTEDTDRREIYQDKLKFDKNELEPVIVTGKQIGRAHV